jgi:hypothetical protein
MHYLSFFVERFHLHRVGSISPGKTPGLSSISLFAPYLFLLSGSVISQNRSTVALLSGIQSNINRKHKIANQGSQVSGNLKG